MRVQVRPRSLSARIMLSTCCGLSTAQRPANTLRLSWLNCSPLYSKWLERPSFLWRPSTREAPDTRTTRSTPGSCVISSSAKVDVLPIRYSSVSTSCTPTSSCTRTWISGRPERWFIRTALRSPLLSILDSKMTIMMLPVGEVSKKYIPNLLRRYRRASAAIAIAQAEGLIGIDAAVAEKRPDAPHGIAAGEIDLHQKHLRLVVGARHHLALRAGDAAAAPELDAGADAGRVRFEAASVAGQHRQAVGDCMGALNGGPCLALARLLIIGVGWMPADGGGVEQSLRAGQRHKPGGLGKPLLPAPQHAEPADGGVD